MHTQFWSENLKGSDYLEDVGIDGKIMLEWIFGNRWEGLDWMHLAQGRDQWKVLVNMVINLLVP
jgi:hypothetical protein